MSTRPSLHIRRINGGPFVLTPLGFQLGNQFLAEGPRLRPRDRARCRRRPRRRPVINRPRLALPRLEGQPALVAKLADAFIKCRLAHRDALVCRGRQIGSDGSPRNASILALTLSISTRISPTSSRALVPASRPPSQCRRQPGATVRAG
jgi:hypothetical protein